MALVESGGMIKVVECPDDGTEDKDKVKVIKHLSKKDRAEVAFIGKFTEDGGCSATHGIAEIDCIAKVDEQCQTVDGDKQPATYLLVSGSLLAMPGQEHKHDIETVGDEDCRCVKH